MQTSFSDILFGWEFSTIFYNIKDFAYFWDLLFDWEYFHTAVSGLSTPGALWFGSCTPAKKLFKHKFKFLFQFHSISMLWSKSCTPINTLILTFYSCFYNSTYFSTYVLVWTMYFCNICFSGYYILVWKLHFFNSYNSKFNFIFRIWFVNFQACGIVIWKLESCGELSMSSNSD